VVLIARTGALLPLGLVGLGLVTCIPATAMGLCQNGAKRVVAYSTCSQLGYMMVSHGLGQSSLALAHLLTHACFKAALFLGAGSVIHATAATQDQRRYGSVGVVPLPATVATLTPGWAISGGLLYQRRRFGSGLGGHGTPGSYATP
jgi:NADH-quinone oxidoreductase subunit L